MGFFLATALAGHHRLPTRSFWTLLLPYTSIYFFVSLGDAIMSYVSPVYIQRSVSHPALMGLIISSSSVVGLACDLLFPKWFGHRRFTFFFWTALITAVLFPAIFLALPPLLVPFLLGMAVWGIYYELLLFSDFNFIKDTLPKAAYAGAWGTISSFKALAYVLGPIISGWLISKSFSFTFIFTLIFYFVAAFGFWLFTRALPPRPVTPAPRSPSPPHPLSLEIKTWWLLLRKIWPVYIFIFLIFVVDSAFWTIGTLISEELREVHPLGSLFLPAYSAPTLVIGLLVNRLFPPTGKKRIAFISAAIAGLWLAAIGPTSNLLLLLALVFSASVFLSIAFPEITAVFEDYVSRLGAAGNDMIGLHSSASSLAYIIGPIVAGLLAAVAGTRAAFSLIGLALAGYSLLAFFIVPKKIRLPEAEISQSTT